MTKPQKYRDVARFLRQQEWSHARTRGSHEVWVSADGSMQIVIAAHHGEVSSGIVRQLQQVFPETPKNWN